jgi:hypothetical protein
MKMKATMRLLAVAMLLAVTSWQNIMPAHAANPTFDVTGVWKGNPGEIQIFQEKDEVNAILINNGFAHRLTGRYVTPTKIRMTLIRRTRPGGCEMTMTVDLNISSANAFSGTAIASESACGLSSGQSFPDTWTRVL